MNLIPFILNFRFFLLILDGGNLLPMSVRNSTTLKESFQGQEKGYRTNTNQSTYLIVDCCRRKRLCQNMDKRISNEGTTTKSEQELDENIKAGI